MEENVRLRLVFEDRHMLRKPQRKEGLKRSWVLLKPCHQIMADLSLHILDVFHLEDSCPHGLILSMDGFVLPPFESTCILKDKDIISVKKKGKSSDLLKSGGEINSSKKLAIVVRKPEQSSVKPLAKKELREETGGYESKSEDDEESESEDNEESESEDNEGDQLENTLPMDDAPSENKHSKKGKSFEKLNNSKRKGKKHTSAEEVLTVPDAEKNKSISNNDNVSKKKRKLKESDLSSDVSKELAKSRNPEITEKSDDSSESTLSGERRKRKKHTSAEEVLTVPDAEKNKSISNNDDDNVSKKKRKLKENYVSSDVSKELAKSSNHEIMEKSDDSSESTSSGKRSHQPEANMKTGTNALQTAGETKKGPSRSARRKKAKRRWLREMARVGNKESHQSKLFKDNGPTPCSEICKINKGRQQTDPESDVCKEPCQVESLPRGDTKLPKEVQQSDHYTDEGEDVVPVVIRPGHIRFEPLGKGQESEQNRAPVENFQWNGITSKKKGQKWGTEKAASSKRTDYRSFSQESTEMSSEKLTKEKNQIDFEKLAFCAGLPNVGDVIAYRLIELSSTWTPELSSFRVGQVSQFDKTTNQVTLKPVLEYPIVFEKKVDEEGSLIQPDTSLYAEDGSLEIDYSSLIEVRIVKSADVNTAATVVTAGENEASLRYQDAASDRTNNGKGISNAPNQEHGKVNGWGSSQAAGTKEAHGKVNGWEGSAPVLCPEKPRAQVNNRETISQSLSTNQQVNGWEEISQALNAKKAQLSQKDNSGKKEGSGRNSLPYKAWRGSALGPTVTVLRAQNQL